MDATPDSVYQLIKSFEGQFTPPAPYFTINVGTLDVDTGAFSGLTTHSETDPEPIEHGPHQTPKNPPPRFVGETYVTVSISASWRQTVTVSPAPKVPLQPVLLVFSISHPIADPWSISANGVTLTAQPGQTSLQADVWDAQFANWSVQAGSASFTDTIRFQRPGSVPAGAAAGAFTIPILPVTIVYAPPADSTLKSTSNYVQGQTVGTTNTFDTSTDTSQTSPVASAEVVAMATLKQGLDTASKILSLGGGEEKAVGIVLSSISQQLGTISSTGTSGTFDDSQNQITVIESTTDALTASVINGGPGSGDIFCFYHNLQADRRGEGLFHPGRSARRVRFLRALHPRRPGHARHRRPAG